MAPSFSLARLRLTRRELLRILVALSAYLPAPMLLAAVAGKDPTIPPAFGPYLDTLLPSDESPSASQLGLEAIIVDGARINPKLTQLIQLGCAWLDQQATKLGAVDFAALEESDRIAIVKTAERAARRSLPLVFFTATRDLAFREYYVLPEAWKSLGYSGPPQPTGYPGHDRALDDST
jgi:hypothetical protein